MNMKIEIEIEEKNMGISFADEKGNLLHFEDLSRTDQIRILNAFAQSYNFWKQCLKEEGE